jgi:hypothetical protein
MAIDYFPLWRRRTLKKKEGSQVPWLTPITLATWDAIIGRTAVPGQPWQKVHKNPSQPIVRHADVHLSSL